MGKKWKEKLNSIYAQASITVIFACKILLLPDVFKPMCNLIFGLEDSSQMIYARDFYLLWRLDLIWMSVYCNYSAKLEILIWKKFRD